MQYPGSKKRTTVSNISRSGQKSSVVVRGDRQVQNGALQTQSVRHDVACSTKKYINKETGEVTSQRRFERHERKNPAEGTGLVELSDSVGETSKVLPTPSTTNTSYRSPNDAGMIIPACMRLDSITCGLLRNAMHHPPVTVSTLGELNLNWLMHYINLRCDINYDHDLHFTPIKGTRGDEKRRNAEEYWLALTTEFRIYQQHPRDCSQCHNLPDSDSSKFQPRLFTMFQDLRDLLETLVPDRDHDEVAANLDTGLLMQEVQNGVLDIAKLSQWLAGLLKNHCAPMRDESAEEMAEQLEYGANNGDLSTLVRGLEHLFGFLEVMKLDVANHQIRTFRYQLIAETIPFQQEYFRKKIADRKLDIAPTHAWYQHLFKEYQLKIANHSTAPHSVEFEVLVYGLCRLCSASEPVLQLPATLHFDQGRMHQLRMDVRDLIFLKICRKVFDRLLNDLGCWRSIHPAVYTRLQHRILTIVDNDFGEDLMASWRDNMDNVAIEITRAAFVACHHAAPHVIPPDMFNQTGSYLDQTGSHLRQAVEQFYESFERDLLTRLAESSLEHAAVFQTMSTVQISETQKHYQQNRQQSEIQTFPDLENMARSLAHLGVLHWQVWWDLVYMRDEEKEQLLLEQKSVACYPDKDTQGCATESDGYSRASIESEAGLAFDNTT